MLKELISQGESEILEFKRELPKKDLNFLKTIVAFANCDGGTIIIGVDDENRTNRTSL